MKVKIKATGKEIVVEPYGDEYAQIFPDGDFKVYTKQELAFPNDEIDWEQVRIQAAMYAMQSIADSLGSIDYNKELIAKHAVELADALVSELKKGG